ncbi:WD repeat-containing protein 12 [Borealophlyctis nickersoniae]|nr:WD repeat-containing protein 12 [Borealophlyctis nickersoniae]
MSGNDAKNGGDAQVQVRFRTKIQKYAITDAPILVPTRLRRYGLSEIVNHLLDLAKPVPFDFLIDGKFLRTSLHAYLEANGLSTENTLDIEYVDSTLPPTQAATLKHDDWISAVKGHRKSPYIGTACYDTNARIWDRSGNCLGVLQGHQGAVKSFAWVESDGAVSDDGRLRCLTGGLDQRIYGWEFLPEQKKSKVLFACGGEAGTVNSIAVNSTGSHFASAYHGGSICVWTTSEDDVEEDDQDAEQTDSRKRRRLENRPVPVKRPSATLDAHVGSVSSVVYQADAGVEAKLYSGGMDHSVRVWDVETAANTSTMNCEVVILDIDYSKNSRLLVTGHTDNALRLWDPRAQEGLVVKLKLTSHTNWASSASWSPSSLYTLASGSYDSTLKVWDIRSPSTPLYSIQGANEKDQKVLSVDWTEGGLILSGGEDGVLRVNVCKTSE